MTPQQIADISEPIEQIYSEMTDELLLNIAKHLNSSTTTWTALNEIETLEQMGQLTDENIRIINSYVQKIPPAVKEAMNDSRLQALSEIEEKLAQGMLSGHLSKPVSDSTVDVTKALSQQAISQLNLVNQTMLNSSLEAYQAGVYSMRQSISSIQSEEALAEAQRIIDMAAGSTTLGTETRTGALRKALRQLNANGITGFYDKLGRSWTAEAYVNMDIRTTVHNTYIQSIKSRQEDYGSDVFQVSAHAGARPLCYPYQGKLYSWGSSGGYITLGDGKRYRFESIKETSYGEPAGLFGINCGHVPYPMIAGVSERVEEEIQDEAENEREYKESQVQRSLERKIRYQKRALEMLGDNATPEDKEILKKYQAEMRAFIKETGRTRRYDREQIVTDKEERRKGKTEKKPTPPPRSEAFKELEAGAKAKGITYKPVKDRGEVLDYRSLIKTIAGGDKTDGSCVSVALTYIGQKSGWDVRDFRGGDSRQYFARNVNNRELRYLSGVNPIIEEADTSLRVGKRLLNQVEQGKEYLFVAGRHASIVRRDTAGDVNYLELQSPVFNGWQTMYNEERVLQDRFGCDSFGISFEYDGFLIDTEELKGSEELKELLGYINTDEGEEQKGSGGHTR